MTNHRGYIPHIDGMRAISVLVVIFFHFHLLGFTGGFVGVDVFFTISGFLIIGSIVGQVEAKRFKATDFWGRRVRRLFPAIFSTLLLCFIAGFLVMSPGDYVKLAKDSLFGLVSLINFTLLQQTDYFDLQGFNEPLLHFWSLAVEEQFYMVFPLLALAVLALVRNRTFYKQAIVIALLVLSVLSIVGAEWAIRNGHSLFAYYMMPARFFQLALGGVLAIALQSETFAQRRDSLPKIVHDILVLAGIATIIFLSLYFTKHTPFPGVNAVWPTLAALALLYGGGNSHFSFLLENPISAHLGKLSYSLYLVHWPVWIFMCYYLDRELLLPEKGIALAATYLISFAIFQFVESPVRFSPLFKGGRLFAVLGPAAAFTAAGLFATIFFHGWVQRIPEQQREFAVDAAEYHRTHFGGVGYLRGQLQVLGNPRAEPEFLLIGDSKACQMASGIDKFLLQRNRSAEMIAQDGCSLLPGIGRIVNDKRDLNCQEVTQRVLQRAKDMELPIIYVRYWPFSTKGDAQHYHFGGAQDGEKATLAEAVEAQQEFLKRLAAPSIVVFGSNDFFKQTTTIADCLVRPKFIGLPCLKSSELKAEDYVPTEFEVAVQEFVDQQDRMRFVSATDVFCPSGLCQAVSQKGEIIYSDGTHLSLFGSDLITPNFLKMAGVSDEIGANVGDVRDVDEIFQSIERSWADGKSEDFQTNLSDLVLFSENNAELYAFVEKLWNGSNEVPKNRALAVPVAEYLSDAKDETLSTYVAGFAYWWGEGGVQKDFAKALHYWTKPSQGPNATVQYRVAMMYLDETGNAYDRDKGLDYMNKAAQAGQADALKWLETQNTP